MSSEVSLTSWGEGASLALVGHLSSDGITIKIPYGIDVLLHQRFTTSTSFASQLSYWPIRLVKTKSDFIVGSVQTGLGK